MQSFKKTSLFLPLQSTNILKDFVVTFAAAAVSAANEMLL